MLSVNAAQHVQVPWDMQVRCGDVRKHFLPGGPIWATCEGDYAHPPVCQHYSSPSKLEFGAEQGAGTAENRQASVPQASKLACAPPSPTASLTYQSLLLKRLGE